jgi:hypothetical protein
MSIASARLVPIQAEKTSASFYRYRGCVFENLDANLMLIGRLHVCADCKTVGTVSALRVRREPERFMQLNNCHEFPGLSDLPQLRWTFATGKHQCNRCLNPINIPE